MGRWFQAIRNRVMAMRGKGRKKTPLANPKTIGIENRFKSMKLQNNTVTIYFDTQRTQVLPAQPMMQRLAQHGIFFEKMAGAPGFLPKQHTTFIMVNELPPGDVVKVAGALGIDFFKRKGT